MNRLQKLFTKQEKHAVGLISGTSLDGVDAALVRIKNHGLATELELLHFITMPYPAPLKEKLLELSTPGQGSVDEICRVNVLLGEIFADAVSHLLDAAGVQAADVDLIGSHGQTVQHLPRERVDFGYKTRSTLQLGEPSVIAKRTGIITVADFRQADMAVGGEGAPLVPYFDFVVFRSAEKNRALLNLGGIANLTILRKNCSLEEVLAFDSGPANMLIDELMHRLFKKPFDENGVIARSGQPSKKLLARALQHDYFGRKPPKSTGREEFGMAFCTKFLEQANRLKLTPSDIVATAAEFTALSIWNSYRDFVAPEIPLDELIVSGGGTRNAAVMESLRLKFKGIVVTPIDTYGIPADAKEAICFAVLANETLAGHANNVPAATGASQPTVLGKICV
ncbi:MAG: anhydro-N-acetylmuramic acid kinase [bacterium]